LVNSYDAPDDSCSSTKRGASGSPRRRYLLIFYPADFHFHHHVLCDDPAAEKTTATAATINLELKDRRPGSDQRRHSRSDFQCEGKHRASEGGRQRKDRNGEIGHYKCAEGELNH